MHKAWFAVAAIAVAILLFLLLQPGDAPKPPPDGPVALQNATFRSLDVQATGSEPTLGHTRSGTLFLTGGQGLVYKREPGLVWVEVGDVRGRDYADQDPYLWVDRLRDRVSVGYLYNFACTNMFWSDDEGQSWEQNVLGGCLPPGQDHPSWASGPPPEGVTGLTGPSIMYYQYAQGGPASVEGTRGLRSLDGGRTWQDERAIFPLDNCHGGLAGHPAVGPTGIVYVAGATCQGLRIGVSRDAGLTWNVVHLNDHGMVGDQAGAPPQGLPNPGLLPATQVTTPRIGNPSVAVDANGTAYAAWTGTNGRLIIATSSDEGRTWSSGTVSSPSRLHAVTFAAITADAPGRFAVTYLASTSNASTWTGGPAAQNAPSGTVWHLYIGLGQTEPWGIATTQITPDADPVQRGQIWQGGGTAPSRNLRDFIDIDHVDGRVIVAYTDGCRACRNAQSSTAQDLFVAVQDTGLSLRGHRLSPFE